MQKDKFCTMSQIKMLHLFQRYPVCFHLKNALLLLFLHLQLQAHFMSRQTESVVAQEAEVADA